MTFSIPLITVFHLVFLFAGLAFIQSAPEPRQRLSRVLAFWILTQVGLSFSGFYSLENGASPRPVLLVFPAVLLIAGLFFSAKGRAYMAAFDQQKLLLLHGLRVPVEWCLFVLASEGWVPEAMTWNGTNFDVLSGIAALALYAWSLKGTVPAGVMRAFNVLGLLLLLNVMFTAMLSVPGPLQQINFDQPNKAVLEYPFVLLPALIVPMVLFAHLASFIPKKGGVQKSEK